jgi:hypothetical protein
MHQTEHTVVYVVLEGNVHRRIHAVCATAEEAELARQEMQPTLAKTGRGTQLTIHAMHAAFPGDRYRLVYGRPKSIPTHPLAVPEFCLSRLTNTDAHSEAYLYPDKLFVHRKEALAAAAWHNAQQLARAAGSALDWAVVVEVGEPLWHRYGSECLVRKGCGWEELDRVRPVRLVHPTVDEVTLRTDEVPAA